MISKNKIGNRVRRKSNPEIVETLLLAKKSEAWMKIAQIVSASTKRYSSVNLKEIEKNTSEGDTIVIPGKVLGSGNLTKRIRVCALSFSESAKEKMKKTKSEAVILMEEIKSNPKAEGVKVLR